MPPTEEEMNEAMTATQAPAPESEDTPVNLAEEAPAEPAPEPLVLDEATTIAPEEFTPLAEEAVPVMDSAPDELPAFEASPEQPAPDAPMEPVDAPEAAPEAPIPATDATFDPNADTAGGLAPVEPTAPAADATFEDGAETVLTEEPAPIDPTVDLSDLTVTGDTPTDALADAVAATPQGEQPVLPDSVAAAPEEPVAEPTIAEILADGGAVVTDTVTGEVVPAVAVIAEVNELAEAAQASDRSVGYETGSFAWAMGYAQRGIQVKRAAWLGNKTISSAWERCIIDGEDMIAADWYIV